MQGLDASGTIARDAFDALSASIAVLDARGVIVAVNDAWIRFAIANGAGDERFFVGVDYLAICEKARADAADPLLENAMRGLRAMLAGTESEFSLEYPCDSPEEQRWYVMRATRLQQHAQGGVVVAHEDITLRKRAERTLAETDRILRSVLEAMPVGIWIMDRTGRIVHGNRAGKEIWGGARYVGPERFGEYKGWWLSTGAPIAADEWAGARAIRNGETSIDEEIQIECFDGTRKVILNSAVPLIDESRAIEGAILVNQDITERIRDEVELRRAKEDLETVSRELALALERERILGRVDEATGLINRRRFFELVEHEILVSNRYHRPLSLMLFDIDDFKRANDTLGHRAGDEILKRVARVVLGFVRAADVFARYGGDEFVVLLPHTTAEEAHVVAERMRQSVAAQSMVIHGTMPVTISIGIASLRPGDDTVDALIQRADDAMYAAKRAGRNRSSVAPPA